MDEYLCLTLLSGAGQTEAEFKARLSAAWTSLLRAHLALFEKVYAETTVFERDGNRLTRKYLIEADAAAELQKQLRELAMDFEPVDEADVYSKFEATPPEWYWIEH